MRLRKEVQALPRPDGLIASLDGEATRAEAVAALAEAFRLSGIEEPAREARLAVLRSCGLAPADLIASPDRPLGDAVLTLREVALRRMAREPLSRILGWREFWGMRFEITPAVLDPRPETESIVEAALERFAARRTAGLRILDLGVGSGALLSALLREFPNARGVGVDLSTDAAAVATANVLAHGLESRAQIRVGDWTGAVQGQFDMIVSNPPYIRTADIDRLDPEVRLHDPRLALDGGEDGLDAYRALLPAVTAHLSPEGVVLVEIGAGQAPAVLELAARAGLAEAVTRRDLSGTERVIMARRAQ